MILSLSLLVISAILLIIKRNNRAGVWCGIVSLLSELLFASFWFTEQAKGRAAWYELAFSHPVTVLILAAALGLTIANAVTYYRKEEEYYIGEE